MLRLADASTATYVALLDRQGNFLFGVGDMEIHNQLSIDWVRSKTLGILLSKNEDEIASSIVVNTLNNSQLGGMEIIFSEQVKQHEEEISRCSLLVMDGNTPISTMCYILALCSEAKVPGRRQHFNFVKNNCL